MYAELIPIALAMLAGISHGNISNATELPVV